MSISNIEESVLRTKSILEMNDSEIRSFLLKKESYSNLLLPQYFDFQGLLDKVSTEMRQNPISNYFNMNNGKTDKPENYDNTNYSLYNNKDGHYAWRNIQLIHPALYVNLVNVITEASNWALIRNRFEYFGKIKNVING